MLELRRAALGLALSVLVLASVAAIEALRFAVGDYQLRPGSLLLLLAGHGLLAVFIAVPGAVMLAVASRLDGDRRRVARLWVVLLPVWTLFWVVGALLNKLVFPAVASLAGIAANGLLAAAFVLLAWVLARAPAFRKVASWCLVAVPAVTLVVAVAVARAGALPSSALARDDGGRGDPGRPSIVLVTFDTLRADHLGAYGYGLPTSPAFDELATRSFLFENAYSPSNWTRPAVASLMTSTLPSRHGVVHFRYAVPKSLELLTESFRRASYRTAVFAANPNVGPEDGYDRGTDHFVQYSNRGLLPLTFLFKQVLAEDSELLARAIRAFVGEPQPGAGPDPGTLTEAAVRWLGEADGPSFAYLHYLGPHAPYLPPAELLRELGGSRVFEGVSDPPGARAGPAALEESDRLQMVMQYDAEVLWHDREIEELVRHLEARAARRDQILVVTSDHGEAFGENGIWGHGVSLFDEVTQVPLLIWCSSSCGEPRRLAVPVSLLDVAPTLLALAGIAAPELYEGVSLVPVLRGETGDRGRAVISENPRTRERSIRTPEWSLIEGRDPRFEMERLAAMRGELPVAGSEEWQLLRDLLRSTLEGRLAASRSLAAEPDQVELDQERIDELRALGYLQ